MPWIKIDDHFDEHPKLVAVGPLGWALWFAGLAYCNRNLTDGFIPGLKARNLVAWEMANDDETSECLLYITLTDAGRIGDDPGTMIHPNRILDRLVEEGLWDVVAGGFHVHDYAQYQPSKAEVLADRERIRRARENAGRQGGQTTTANRKQTGSKPVAKRQQNGSPVPVPLPPKGGSTDVTGAKETISTPEEIEAGKSAWKALRDTLPRPKETQ